MFFKVCPMCRTKFYSSKRMDLSYIETDIFAEPESEKYKCYQPFRTSTPVSPEKEDLFSNSLDESKVNSSWEDEIYRHMTSDSEELEYYEKLRYTQMNVQVEVEQIVYTVQYFYYYPLVMPTYTPPLGYYYQAVGYRSDGSYGTLPYYWWVPVS